MPGKPAARLGDATTHGTPLSPGIGSINVLIGGQPAWRAMVDQHLCPAASVTGADGVGSVMLGSPTVLINGQMATRLGDIVVEKPGLALGPANPIAAACPTVMIGEVGVVPPAVVPPVVLIPNPVIPAVPPVKSMPPPAGGAAPPAAKGAAAPGKPGKPKVVPRKPARRDPEEADRPRHTRERGIREKTRAAARQQRAPFACQKKK